MINIGITHPDAHYRYKRPCLNLSIQGKDTQIHNLKDIASALQIAAEYIMKYISYELGTSFIHNTLRGRHTYDTLSAALEKFIKRYITCINCGLPELKFSSGKKTLDVSCSSCGHVYSLSGHRLDAFISKNTTGQNDDDNNLNDEW